jgi:molybdopterin converting factor small subunit
MQIIVKLFATYQVGRFKKELRHYPAGATAQTVIEELELKKDRLGSVLINGRVADLDQGLTDGDILALFPLVAGG